MASLRERDFDQIVALLMTLAPRAVDFVWTSRDTDFVRDLLLGSRDVFGLFAEGQLSEAEAASVTVDRTYAHMLRYFPEIPWGQDTERWGETIVEIGRILERARAAR